MDLGYSFCPILLMKTQLRVIVFVLSDSVIQFCSTAFAYYAQATAAQEIFGHTLQSLRGIKYLYKSVNFYCTRMSPKIGITVAYLY